MSTFLERRMEFRKRSKLRKQRREALVGNKKAHEFENWGFLTIPLLKQVLRDNHINFDPKENKKNILESIKNSKKNEILINNIVFEKFLRKKITKEILNENSIKIQSEVNILDPNGNSDNPENTEVVQPAVVRPVLIRMNSFPTHSSYFGLYPAPDSIENVKLWEIKKNEEGKIYYVNLITEFSQYATPENIENHKITESDKEREKSEIEIQLKIDNLIKEYRMVIRNIELNNLEMGNNFVDYSIDYLLSLVGGYFFISKQKERKKKYLNNIFQRIVKLFGNNKIEMDVNNINFEELPLNLDDVSTEGGLVQKEVTKVTIVDVIEIRYNFLKVVKLKYNTEEFFLLKTSVKRSYAKVGTSDGRKVSTGDDKHNQLLWFDNKRNVKIDCCTCKGTITRDIVPCFHAGGIKRVIIGEKFEEIKQIKKKKNSTKVFVMKKSDKKLKKTNWIDIAEAETGLNCKTPPPPVPIGKTEEFFDINFDSEEEEEIINVF